MDAGVWMAGVALLVAVVSGVVWLVAVSCPAWAAQRERQRLLARQAAAEDRIRAATAAAVSRMLGVARQAAREQAGQQEPPPGSSSGSSSWPDW